MQQALERALSSQLKSSLTKPLHEGMRSNFEQHVIPVFEAATRAMFGQIERTFQTGLQQHLRKAAGSSDEIAASLQQSVAHVQSLAVTMKQELLSGQRQLVQQAEAAASAAPVGAGQPAASRTSPAGDLRTTVTQLLAAKDYEQAFTTALTSNSLDVFLWLCRQVDTEVVFGGFGSLLSDVLLLTMVKYLAEDLTLDVPLRLNWTLESASNLNPKHPDVAPHLQVRLEACAERRLGSVVCMIFAIILWVLCELMVFAGHALYVVLHLL